MNTNALKRAIAMAEKAEGPIGKIIFKSIEVETIIPSRLTVLLEEDGYAVTYHTGPEHDAPEGDHPHGAWVRVTKPSPIKDRQDIHAQGYSHSKGDALVQACAAAMREEEIARKTYGTEETGLVKVK